jgi:hypothetical protein
MKEHEPDPVRYEQYRYYADRYTDTYERMYDLLWDMAALMTNNHAARYCRSSCFPISPCYL